MNTPSNAPVDKKRREPIMRWFKYNHLQTQQANVSRWFCELAEMLQILPPCEERSVALRKLLESKDAAVRASIPEEEETPCQQ
jgi:lipopolysaccharide biosynthesis regulator YciM